MPEAVNGGAGRPISVLVHRVVTALLRRTGRSYALDDSLAPSLLADEVFRRAMELLRGFVRLRRRVFLGAGVTIRGHRGLDLAPGVSIGAGSVLDARGWRGITIGVGSRLGRNGVVTAVSRLSLRGQGLVVGAHSGIGDNFHLGCSGGITIGDNVIVGPGLYVHSQEHVYEDPDMPIREQGTVEEAVEVADDCWIGSRVTLLAGAGLGPRTIVASGAVVKGKHPGNEILAGVPARRTKEL